MDDDWKTCGKVADFISFSFHVVNVFESKMGEFDCKEWTKIVV